MRSTQIEMSHSCVGPYQPQTNTMDVSDSAVHAMIMDAIDNYKPPVQRRATKTDFAAAQSDFDRFCQRSNLHSHGQTESVPGHREQAEYGAKKRIKP